MNNYALYKFRKPNTPTPATFLQLMETKSARWLIVEGVLQTADVERSDLVYCGHGMSYETAIKEIGRLERGGF